MLSELLLWVICFVIGLYLPLMHLIGKEVLGPMGYFVLWVPSQTVWNHCPHWVCSWTHHASQKHSHAYFITTQGQDVTYTRAACLPNTPSLILCWARVLSLISAELVEGCTTRLLNNSLIHDVHACDKAEREYTTKGAVLDALSWGKGVQCRVIYSLTEPTAMDVTLQKGSP